MPVLLLVIAATLMVLGLTRYFKQTDPCTHNAFIKSTLLVVASLSLVLMAVTGRLPQVLGILGAALPFLWPYLQTKFMAQKAAQADDVVRSTTIRSRREALDILGLDAEADADAIKAAHLTLMKKIHPDQGGSPVLAQMLNAARDYLLKHNA